MRIPAARVTVPSDDWDALFARFRQTLETGRLTLGPFTKAFETAFAKEVGSDHAVAVNSGTSALEIIMRSLDLTGKEVLVPTNTFYATAGAAIHAGARVSFVDVDQHLMADVEALEEAIGPGTGAVLAVHIGGFVHPEIRRIEEMCEDRGVPLIEDAAHAHASRLRGQAAATFGIAGAFSFYPTKVITTGEGGMIVTDDARLARRARTFRDQGKAGFGANYHVELGYNWRMSELHASLGLAQLERLPEYLARRKAAAQRYDEGLHRIPQLTRYIYSEESSPNFYKYIANLGPAVDRTALKGRLRKDFDISLSGEVYETPLHRQPVFADGPGADPDAFPGAERYCATHVCLPLYPSISEDELEYVLRGLEEALV